MAEEKKKNSRAGALDDEQRVKVLSPSMLVFKRFIRNKLAIVGVAFILFMFLFAFVGGWVSPYGEDQVFTHYEGLEKDFASVTVNNDYRYTVVDGQAFDSLAQSKFILALNTGAATFEAQGKTYSFEQKGQDLYVVNGTAEVARGMSNKMMTAVKPVEGVTLPDGFEAAANEAIKAGQTAFEFEGVNYVVTIEGK